MQSHVRMVILAVFLIFCSNSAAVNGVAGESVYMQHCASCHSSGAPRTPIFSRLQQLSPEQIVSALEIGVMKHTGMLNLTRYERISVAEFITDKTFKPIKQHQSANNACQPEKWPEKDPFMKPHWNGWGVDYANTRFQPLNMAGLDINSVKNLRLKWAYGFPGVTSMESQPTIVDDRLFIGTQDGTVYAIDAKTACTYWTFRAEAGVKGPITIGTIDKDEYFAFFGDLSGHTYALDAASGMLKWKVVSDPHPSARIVGGVQFFEGKVFTPLVSFEEVLASEPDYDCCWFRGSVIAYDAKTGALLWQRYMIDELAVTQTGTSNKRTGKGPSGAGIWSTLTIDKTRRRLYAGTGNNYSAPATTTSDAIIALSLDNGEVIWIYQGLAGDVWNTACVMGDPANCPKHAGPDHDMGASPILTSIAGKRPVIVGTQKSGFIHVLDLDGKLIWKRQFAVGGILGALHWGQATDGHTLYIAKSDVRFRSEDYPAAKFELDPDTGGGLIAADLASGTILWQAPPHSCQDRNNCSPAQSAAVSAIPGVVFSGSLGGIMRAFDAKNGKEVWRFDTVREYETVNGITANGGSIDQAGAVIVDGMVYFVSGYLSEGGIAGNVLLVFEKP